MKTDGYQAVADHIGVAKGALTNKVMKLRKKGHEVDTAIVVEHESGKRRRPKCVEGTIVTKNVKGTGYIYQKQGKKWVLQGRADGKPIRKHGEKKERKPRVYIPRGEKKEKKVKPVKQKAIGRPQPPPKKAEPKYKTVVRDERELVYVRVDERTTIQIKATEDKEEAIARWKSRYQQTWEQIRKVIKEQ